MRTIHFAAAITLALLAASPEFLAAVPSRAAETTYKITDFGVLDGAGQSRANAISSGSVVVGEVLTDDPQYYRAVLRRSGKLTELVAAENEDAYAADVNKGRRVAGSLRENLDSGGYGPYRAVVWSGSKVTELAMLSGGAARATALNDANDVAGYATVEIDGDVTIHACLWSGDEVTDLGTLGEGTISFGNDINNDGRIVGQSTTEPGGDEVLRTAHAVLWDDGEIVDLGTLGGAGSSAEAINDDGWIVGSSDTSDPDGYNITHAFLWNDGELTDVGAWGDARGNSYAFGINGKGQVVGQVEDPSTRPNSVWYAALWQDGEFLNLNDVIPANRGWVLESANDVNDKGQIVGQGTLDGVTHGFILTPVEPDGDTAGIPGLFATVADVRHGRLMPAAA